MPATPQLHVVIVGAGIGGLGTALAIRNSGHRVTVLEQAADFVEVSETMTNPGLVSAPFYAVN
jgi:salicylate hydroxylase